MKPRTILLTAMRSPHVPTRVSIPFEQGEVRGFENLIIQDASGHALPSQGRSLLDWKDGSAKWGQFVFEPGDSDGPFTLKEGQPEGDLLLREEGDLYRIDTGRVVIDIPIIRSWPNAICYPPFVASLSYKDERGGLHPLLRGTPHTGLRVAEADGRVFLSERTLNADQLMNEPLRRRTREVTVVERGPVRAWVQIRGISACDIYSPGLDYVIGIEAYRNSSLVKFEVTWRHADQEVYHLVQDLRFTLPFANRCRRVTTGLEHGATTDNLAPGSEYRVLQEDEGVYYADRLDPNGERVGLAWGSGHGRTAPGWMQARFDDGRISVAVRDFVREYPNEIRVTEDEVSVGLWPQDAADRIASKRLLPIHPLTARDPNLRHRHTIYDNLACHPYWAFFDPETRCLETVQGMQKTQVLWADVDPALDSLAWNRRVREDLLEINQARVACEDLRKSATYASVYQLDREKRPAFAHVLDVAARWLTNHEEAFHVTGKFDAGDLIYIWAPHSSSKDHDRKHAARREHSRMGYWNNNEEDPCHGLHTYFLATGDVRACRTAANMARHMWDIDIRHYPHLGMYTHCYGHCFRGGSATATDHFWIEGLLDYYLLCGDPEIRAGISGLTRFLAQDTERIRFEDCDLRTVSLFLMQLVNYNDFSEDVDLVERARRMAESMIAEQHPDGFFPLWGSAARRRFAEQKRPGYDSPHTAGQGAWFSTLALQGLMGLYTVDPDPRWREAFYRQFDFLVDHCLFGEHSLIDERTRLDRDTIFHAPNIPTEPHADWSSPEFQRILVFAYQDRKDPKYLEMGRRMMGYYTSRPYCGPEWGKRLEGLPVPGKAHDDDGNRVEAAPDRHEDQVRPLVPSTNLRCLPAMMALLMETGTV